MNPQKIHLQLPKGIILTEQQLIEFSQINDKKVETEYKNGYMTLIINLMGNFSKATRFTTELITELNIWNRKMQLGIVYPESQMYRVAENIYKEGDTSFVAFAKAVREKQREWFDKIADIPATLLIEISGNKVNAKIDLAKTIEYWISAGTDYVLVLDLEEEQWHFFERSANYSTHSFSEKFIAPADLPDLLFDFKEIAQNCDF